jgi:hypothetical protein
MMKRSVFRMGKATTLACCFFAGTWLGLACGSAGDEPGANSPAPTPQSTQPMSTPTATTPMGGSSSVSPSPSPTTTQVPAGGSAADSPAATETSTAVDDGCAALGATDACAGCICDRCSDTLQTCVETDGCPEILACVRESGCTGRDCFCGDAGLIECLEGAGNGPCRDVILAAPGGHAPTAQDPSAGPASQAAQDVGNCAEDDDQCSELCVFED